MTLSLYMDHHVRRAITKGLRQRNVNVLTAEEDGCKTLSDPELLDRATALGRTLFTHDEDLLSEAARRQKAGLNFAGVIHQMDVSVRRCIDDLEIIAKVGDATDFENQVWYLPL